MMNKANRYYSFGKLHVLPLGKLLTMLPGSNCQYVIFVIAGAEIKPGKLTSAGVEIMYEVEITGFDVIPIG